MCNSENFISETINSVVNQTYNNWELILIDDFSNDKTINIVNSFILQNNKIKLFKNKTNLGAAASRNKGIEVANGSFIAFLDADDLWKPNKLETQLLFMKNKDCDICFSSYDLINEKGENLNKRVKALKTISYRKLLKSNYIGNLTGIYNTEVLGKIKSPNLQKRQDWLLWLTALKKSDKSALGVQESLAYYRVRNNSMSSNKFKLIKHNYWVYKRGLAFSTLKSIFYMLIFLKEHFFVKSKQIISTKKI